MEDSKFKKDDEIVREVLNNIGLFQVSYIDKKKLMAVFRLSKDRVSIISAKLDIELGL